MTLEDFNIYYVNNWILIPAAFIILFLSFLEKRTFRPDVCNGRPALVIPLPFLDGYENRLAYSVAFLTIMNTFVSLLTSQNTINIDIPLWGRALIVYMQAFVGCLTCFPFFACLSTRYRVAGAIICIVYSIVWLSLSVVSIAKEANDVTNMTIWSIDLSDNVMNRIVVAKALLLGLPNVLSYSLLICCCVYILYRCFTTKMYFNKHVNIILRPHQEEHVRWVFKKSKTPLTYEELTEKPKLTFIQRMHNEKKLRLFTNFPFFKYPTKILAMVCVQIGVVYWMGTLLTFSTIKIAYECYHLAKTFVSIDYNHIIIFSVCGAIGLFTAITNSFIHIFVATRNYRYHLLKIYQGEKEFAVKFEESSQFLLTSSMIYPGYQMSFLVWGCAIAFGFVFLLLLFIVETFYLLAIEDLLKDMLLNIVQVLSFPVTTIILFYLQMLLSKKVLLQEKMKVSDKHPPLNINNRKLFELINYYSLFTNMAVGLATCLLRIILSTFFGVFAVGRLDKSVFTRDRETFDRGYKSYLSMLLVDNAHNNPSMRVFAHLLWTRVLSRRLRQRRPTESFNDKSPLTSSTQNKRKSNTDSTSLDSPMSNPWTFCEYVEEFRLSNKSRKRWFLAYTLMNNMELRKLRKHELAKSLKSEHQPKASSLESSLKEEKST
ncbi:stimulated by retinoic acid 6 protein isoform X1 [Biomphalaria glabrata]|nr:putative stimulated by retinoic acid gene 6 protein isoform X1 [Biomphalaria glabrata]